MASILELKQKIEAARRITGLDLYITNVYKRSRLPYTLGVTLDGRNTSMIRGTKDDLFNWLDALTMGYNTALADNNLR